MADTVNVPAPAGQTTTKLENAEAGFKASKTLSANLQTGLVDFIALELVGQHASPDGRPAVVAASTTLPESPQGEVLTHDAIKVITASIEAVTGTMREVHDQIDEEDPTSADILHGFIQQLEQQAWFISAETRTPSAR